MSYYDDILCECGYYFVEDKLHCRYCIDRVNKDVESSNPFTDLPHMFVSDPFGNLECIHEIGSWETNDKASYADMINFFPLD